jgi:hypothetical protein
MKAKHLLFGILTGGLITYSLLTVIDRNSEKGKIEEHLNMNTDSAQWNWPDSLDALIAASDYHKLVFENSELRILEVTIAPGQLDPIHTHRGKSIVWVVRTSPIVYKTYGIDSNKKLTLVKLDTIDVKTEELNKGTWENPEPPHSVENIGKDIFKLYRIEYDNAYR